jgi:hypothetical protein
VVCNGFSNLLHATGTQTSIDIASYSDRCNITRVRIYLVHTCHNIGYTYTAYDNTRHVYIHVHVYGSHNDRRSARAYARRTVHIIHVRMFVMHVQYIYD